MKSSAYDGNRRKEALAREVAWMKAALEARNLNQLKFRALLELLSGWSDEQLLALVSACFPARRFLSRTAAMKALGEIHRDQTVRLLLEGDSLGFSHSSAG